MPACLSYLNRPNIDWKKEDLFLKIVDQVKKDKKKIIRIVSFLLVEKNSTCQALKLRVGLNQCITSTTCDLSELRKKIENLKQQGFDY